MPSPEITPNTAPSDQDLRDLVLKVLPERLGLRLLKGFKLDFSANPGFRKVFFSISCDCGTAALLSVEVAQSKTESEIKQALPSLVGRLESQARAFRSMPCDMHRRMSAGAKKKEESNHGHREGRK